jgi:hypothetical protein
MLAGGQSKGVVVVDAAAVKEAEAAAGQQPTVAYIKVSHVIQAPLLHTTLVTQF